MKPRLLLHTCCAPCLSGCVFVLAGLSDWKRVFPEKPDYDFSIFFDNPNIYPLSELKNRKAAVKKFLSDIEPEIGKIEMLEDSSVNRSENWNDAVKNFAFEPERGTRCRICYVFRLEETFRLAVEKGFDTVATTLTLSPHKNTAAIHEEGERLSKIYSVSYLSADFKKNGGYQKSIENSKKYGIYRQNYCGCRYSIPE